MLDCNFYRNKKIFITGHTGFKGSWLSLILKEWGADLYGYALTPPDGDDSSLYNIISVSDKFTKEYLNDIRDYERLQDAVEESQPDIIIHLAAQPFVLESYNDPIYNYGTNVMGTANLLEIARRMKNVKAILVVTTDKCYQDIGASTPYHEDARLGGHDPYSTSKAMVELLTQSYYQSFFCNAGIGVATARAGNVIGGGDFGKNRIIPDIVTALVKNKELIIRNPNHVRPWQFVCDVLYGYLMLVEKLYHAPATYSEAYNFAPQSSVDITVSDIIQAFQKSFPTLRYKHTPPAIEKHETYYLRLDTSKAKKELGWQACFQGEKMIGQVISWYDCYLNHPENIVDVTYKQFQHYHQNWKA